MSKDFDTVFLELYGPRVKDNYQSDLELEAKIREGKFAESVLKSRHTWDTLYHVCKQVCSTSTCVSPAGPTPEGKVLVDRGALQAAINMLRRDEARGLLVRGEIAALLEGRN